MIGPLEDKAKSAKRTINCCLAQWFPNRKSLGGGNLWTCISAANGKTALARDEKQATP